MADFSILIFGKDVLSRPAGFYRLEIQAENISARLHTFSYKVMPDVNILFSTVILLILDQFDH